jgi:hypothetical protein
MPAATPNPPPHLAGPLVRPRCYGEWGRKPLGGSDNDKQRAAGASSPNHAGADGNGRRRGGAIGGGAERRRGEARVRDWGTVPRRSAGAFATAPASLSSSLASPWFRLLFWFHPFDFANLLELRGFRSRRGGFRWLRRFLTMSPLSEIHCVDFSPC